MAEQVELREYKYMVNNVETTALLTPAMAERMGAVGVNEDFGTKQGAYTTVYSTSSMAEVTEGGGVGGEHAVEPRREQQQGIDDKGRTASMRPPVSTRKQTRTEQADDTEARIKARKPQDK